MTKQEQEQAFNRRVKQNKGGAVGGATLSADEQTNGQTYKPGISDATNAIVIENGDAAVSNVKKPATQSTLIDAATQQANKENAIDRLLQDRIQTNKDEQQKLEESYQAQQKRQKRNAIISSVADGLSALSNMYFTSKGAPTPTATAPSMSEQQAKQNVADRNIYLELLQGWRKRNNELLDNYATYQAVAASNKLKQQQLAIEQDREARLYIKDKAQQAYNQKLLELKDAKMTNDEKYRQAQLAYKYAELEAKEEIAEMQDATARYRIDKQGRGSTIKRNYQRIGGKNVLIEEQRTYDE